jgi:hypothetical protein
MEDINKQQLGYTPSIEYKDEYYSEVEVPHQYDNDTEDDYEYDPIEELGQDLDGIKDMVSALPENIRDIINDVLNPVIDIWEDDLKGKPYKPIPNNDDISYVIPEEDPEPKEPEPTEPEPDEEDFWDIDPTPSLVVPSTPKDEIIKLEYIKMLKDLLDDYEQKLNRVVSNFWTGAIMAGNTKTSDEIKFIMNDIELKNDEIKDNAKHLLDFGLRSQIYKNVKIDFFSNMYPPEETILHLKQFKTAYELRLRYAQQEEPKKNNKTDVMSGNMLEALNILYDRKYDKSYENLYRYLNSSVEVTDDILKTYLQELKAKQILIEGEGIKK